jgi:hypothetical protein
MSNDAGAVLAAILSAAAGKVVSIQIGAHTDSDGSGLYNRNLAERRGEAVALWFVGQGVPGLRRGDEDPDDGDRELQNRCSCTPLRRALREAGHGRRMGSLGRNAPAVSRFGCVAPMAPAPCVAPSLAPRPSPGWTFGCLQITKSLVNVWRRGESNSRTSCMPCTRDLSVVSTAVYGLGHRRRSRAGCVFTVVEVVVDRSTLGCCTLCCTCQDTSRE